MSSGGKIVRYTSAEKLRILAADYADLPRLAIELQRPLKGMIEAARRWVDVEHQPTNLVFPRRYIKMTLRRHEKPKPEVKPRRKFNSPLSRPDWFIESLNLQAKR